MKKNMQLSSSMEDYLETIAALQKEKGVARVKDISRVMDVKTPSVNAAIKTLYKHKLVDHEKYGYVELTLKGEKVAQSVQRRHDMLLKFFTEILKINPKIAEKDACKTEHSISPETSEKLIKFIEFVEACPESDGPYWLRSYNYYSETGKRLECVIRKETKRKQVKSRKRKEKKNKE